MYALCNSLYARKSRPYKLVSIGNETRQLSKNVTHFSYYMLGSKATSRCKDATQEITFKYFR